MTRISASILSLVLVLMGGEVAQAAERRPNLVFILTDNQGAWTLGCYGNPDIRTPNIDRLAAEGIRFTRALSSNPVCSPTRATFLTGLIPSQHGVHSYLGGEVPKLRWVRRPTARSASSRPCRRCCATRATSAASAASGTWAPT